MDVATTQPDGVAKEREGFPGKGIGQQILRVVGLAWYGLGILVLISGIVKGGIAPFEPTESGPLRLFAGLPYFWYGLVYWWLTISFARAFLRMELEEFLVFFVRLFVPRYGR